MWKKKLKSAVFILAVLFVCLNIFLLIYHEDSIYNRKAYVEDWDSVPAQDLRKMASTEGVYQPDEETTVIFDPALGTYLQTLVEENEEVEENEPLIEYQIQNFEETKNSLQDQLDQVTVEISAVKTTLARLEATAVREQEKTLPSVRENSTIDTEGEIQEDGVGPEEDIEEQAQDEDTATYLREQFRLETEEELASLQARQKRLEEKIDQLQEGQSLQITSPAAGTVTEIVNHESSPSITISSSELVIEGYISEDVRKLAKKGMEVKISGIQPNGKVHFLSDYPEEIFEAESVYAFQVSLETEEEESAEILPGYHTAMQIILEEQLDVPAVHHTYLTDTLVPAVWVLKEDGKISYQRLETGIKDNNWTEIVKGVKAGQFIAEASGNLTDGSLFVTPLELRFIDWNQLLSEEASLIEIYPVLAGLLHR